MPFVANNFSAYPVNIILDANGNGQLSFQATGQNLLITNIYASVSTSVKQAKVSFSKNNVGPQYNLVTSNSGSTGCNTSGTIALLDGETAYVRWEGGDAGATATATFSGVVATFLDVKNKTTQLFVTDPPVAGDGSLIYPAIQSPNFQSGSSGWQITRGGNAEFNNVNLRGGITTSEPNGRRVSIIAGVGEVDFRPQTNVAGFTPTNDGYIRANLTKTSANDGYLSLAVFGPQLNGLGAAAIELRGENTNGEAAYIQFITKARGQLVDPNSEHLVMGGERGKITVAPSGVAFATYTVTFATPFPSGSVPFVSTNMLSSSQVNYTRWITRATGISETGFNVYIGKGDAADPNASGAPVDIQWAAFL